MDKELYIIDSKLIKQDKKNDTNEQNIRDWYFLGAFKTSKEASRYYHNYYKSEDRTGTIVPWDLPGDFNTYFDKFIYCSSCDKYQYHVEKNSVYLVQKNHDGKWHFECLLPSIERAETYINSKDDSKLYYKIVHLKLPYNKDQINYRVELERSNNTKNYEKKIYDKKESKKLLEKIGKESNNQGFLVKIIICICIVNTIISFLK